MLSGGDRLPSACPRQHSSLAALPSSHRRQWGRLSVSLQGAKVLAVRYQRLRRAIECVRLSRDVPRETSPHVDGPGAAAAEPAWAARLAAEMEAGRTLLDSPVLAAEEMSLQLGLPRGALERDRDAVVKAAAVQLGELGVQLEEAAASLREQD